MLSRGLHLHDLGTDRLSWTELRTLIRYLPPGNALAREAQGEAAAWSADTYLLALIADLLANGNWQRAGDRHAKKPKPVERPTLTGAAPASAAKGERIIARGQGVSIDAMAERLGWGDR